MSTSLSSSVRGSSTAERTVTRVLIVALFGRALWNALFVVYLVQRGEWSVASLILAFARFASVDAMLALLMAASWLAVAPRRLLWLSPAVDAATRGALVALVAFGRGGVDVPLTAVLYLWLLATFAFVDGALDLAEGVSLDRELGRRRGWLSLTAGGAVAMAAGIAIFVTDPGTSVLRILLVILSVTHGAVSAVGTRHVKALRDAPYPDGSAPASRSQH